MYRIVANSSNCLVANVSFHAVQSASRLHRNSGLGVLINNDLANNWQLFCYLLPLHGVALAGACAFLGTRIELLRRVL